jgi:HEAT repeat protein
MKTALTVLTLAAAAVVCAQEIAQKPTLFPPIAQILGPEPAAMPRSVDFDNLVYRLRAADPVQRKAAINALGTPENVRAVPYLGAILLQLNEALDVRVAAAMALGRVRNWRAATFLKQSISDGSREVRFASALALGKAKSPETLELLTLVLAKDPDWWVRFAASVALGENKDPKSVQALGRSAETEKEWQVRMQSVRSLGQIGSRDAAYALAKPLRDKDASVRAATAMALGDIGGLDSINILAAALHDENEEFPRQVMSEAIKKLLAKP